MLALYVLLIILLLTLSITFIVLYFQEKQNKISNKQNVENQISDKKNESKSNENQVIEKEKDEQIEKIVDRVIQQEKLIRTNVYIQPPYLILVYIPGYSDDVGGIQVLYQLADHIHKIVNPDICTVKVVNYMHIKLDDIFSEYLTEHDIVDWDKTIVIYPEVIVGNPLNAKNVVRWLLFRPLKGIYDSWSNNDLIYYFSSFSIDTDLPPHKYLMYCIRLRDYPTQETTKTYKSIGMRRKCGKWFTQEEVNDFLAVCDRSVDGYHYNDILTMIQSSDEFRCCDAYSYWNFIAAFVGVTSIVKPIQNTTKEKWCRSLVCSDYIFNKFKPEDYVSELPEFSIEEIKQRQPFGVAWGTDEHEINWANKTKHLCYLQQQQVAKYGEETIQSAINEWYTIFFGEKTRDFFDSYGV